MIVGTDEKGKLWIKVWYSERGEGGGHWQKESGIILFVGYEIFILYDI